MAAPLFLLAPPRSYTSLVNAMLGQHPQCFGLPELCLFNVDTLVDLWRGSAAEISENGPMARHGLLRAVAEIYCGEQSTATVNMALRWASVREHWTTGQVFQEIVDKIHPLVAVEKSPSYTISVKRMRAMLDTFPDARFLHLVRHPVAQAKSLLAINDGAFTIKVNAFEIGEDYALMEPQIAWHDINLNILDFLDKVPPAQQMRMRGEDIMAQPEQRLAEIARWAGLRDDAEAVDQMMHPERSPFACFGPINALFGNDPNFLAGPTFRPHTPKIPPLSKPVPWRDDGKGLHPEVVQLANEFGYV
ncbi:sulfotransferase family protein [Ideonella sp. BN130291]|uniref:sulfotransferase family protein n=1 Tax=Ideonella sp. BN130291 TaxID=3112940 RepID=UPI002E274020|nr:sulfotransferase [Ideonella sp. BN130291]